MEEIFRGRGASLKVYNDTRWITLDVTDDNDGSRVFFSMRAFDAMRLREVLERMAGQIQMPNTSVNPIKK